MTTHLSHHHRKTVEQIFNHPAAGNIEWRHVRSLLENVGDVTEEHNGHLKVTVGPETETFHVPKSKDIDREMVGDLRRMLSQAGIEPGSEAVEDERGRNYGDSRWGEPQNEA